MSYYFSKVLKLSFEDTIEKVKASLQEQGFGVITEIDVKETLKEKINVDFRRYQILGACNPSIAYQALQKEDKLGIMLPCNVIVQELQTGNVEVAAVDPVASMKSIENPSLLTIATQVQESMKKVLRDL